MTELMRSIQAAVNEYGIVADVLPCDSEFADTAAFCEKYGFSPEQSANTILVASRKVEPVKYAVCVVLATTKLDVNKKVCQLLGVKKASFADAETTVKLSNMMIGGVTAVGIQNIPTYVDSAVMKQKKVILGGGNRESKLILEPGQLLKLPNIEVVQLLAYPKST